MYGAGTSYNISPMKRPVKIGLTAGIGAILITAGVEAALASTENDSFQFCTTKAYGWPLPWRIDYCECKGSTTVYPASHMLINAGVIVGSGVISFALFGGLAVLFQRRSK
jgi:hypothetical protein